MKPSSEAAVVFLAYNRPSHTARTLQRIAEAMPKRLFIVVDGPKDHVPGDAEKCASVRSVLARVDWECEVSWNIAPGNLGLRRRVQSGLDWVFDQVDRAVIVEDDCLLDPTFFRFAGELLHRYEDDPRVGVICAQGDELPSDGASYHASRYPLLWGWATWRRVWKLYEPNLETWPAFKSSGLLAERLADPVAVAYWRGQLDRVYAGFDTWDYMINYCCWRHDMLCIHPDVNMLTNIGFDALATNTFHRHTPFGDVSEPMRFPIIHPKALRVSAAREARLLAMHFGVSAEEALRRARSRIVEDADVRTG